MLVSFTLPNYTLSQIIKNGKCRKPSLGWWLELNSPWAVSLFFIHSRLTVEHLGGTFYVPGKALSIEGTEGKNWRPSSQGTHSLTQGQQSMASGPKPTSCFCR